MNPDLQSLEITKGELKHLSGVDTEDVFRPSLLRNSGKRLNFLFNELLIGVALTPIALGIIYIFIIKPLGLLSMNWIILLIIIVPILVTFGRLFWLKQHVPQLLVSLLDDVDRYHAVLKAIDINDQLATAGTPNSTLTDRTKLIEALQLTREDLVRALMSERILRENKSLIAANPGLLTNNLAALMAIQVNDRAGEYGYFLNEALQIGLSVQEEMRKLPKKPSP